MKKIYFTIEEKEYPIMVTMGAFKLFRETTGKEAETAIGGGSFVDMGIWLWCCIKSACRREKVDFSLSLDDFLDLCTPDDIVKMTESVREEEVEVDSKKK